jgi:RNA-directed DNA polymerase
MIETVLNRKNMLYARRQVVKNEGSAGVDGMRTHELEAYLQTHREALE